jgi:hypothetical protein
VLYRASDPIRHIRIGGWQQKAADFIELQDPLWPV